MAELVNEFAWSKTRARNFADCKRLYWFDSYGKWPGWKDSADSRTKEIYTLSKLKSRWMWVGQIVHDSVAQILRSCRAGKPLDPSAVQASVRQRMRDEYASSERKTYRNRGMQKTCALREHEYDEQIKKEEWEKVVSKAESCLKHFAASQILQDLKAVPSKDWLTIDENPPASFVHDDVKVWVKLDAAYRGKDGRVTIIDWKTGSGEDEWAPLQLAMYALYALSQWKCKPDQVRVGLCDLSNPKATYREEVISAEDLDAARKQVKKDVAAMEAKLQSGRFDNKANEGDYPGTDKPKLCGSCSYHKICPVTPLQAWR